MESIKTWPFSKTTEADDKRCCVGNLNLKIQVRNASALSAKQVLEQQPAPELTTLKNGFRVVTEENGRETATVDLWKLKIVIEKKDKWVLSYFFVECLVYGTLFFRFLTEFMKMFKIHENSYL